MSHISAIDERPDPIIPQLVFNDKLLTPTYLVFVTKECHDQRETSSETLA